MRIFRSILLTAVFILAALTGAAALSACGQKGPLKLPPPPEKAPIAVVDAAKLKDSK